MPFRPCVGFVILTWNSEKVILPCLRSIFDLNGVYPAVCVADNGSSDGTLAILREFSDKYPEQMDLIQYDSNQGTTAPRNACLKNLMLKSPDYCCILDSDTIVNDDAIVTMIRELEAHPEYGLIGPCMSSSSGIQQMSARTFPTFTDKLYKAIPIPYFQRLGEELEKQNGPSDGSSYPVDYLMSACWMFRPELLEKAGYLDEKIFYAPEDAEYCIRVWKSGYQVAYCPKAKIIHEWQRLSRKKLFSKHNWEHIKGLAYMFAKHHFLFSAKKLRNNFPKYNPGEDR